MTSPDVPPPVKPLPATTDDISPVSDILNTPLDAFNPEPAMADTKSAIVSFLLAFESLASINTTLSFATSTVAAVNSSRSRASDNAPDVPPPDNPFPAVTPVMSPTCPLIVSVPAASSYDNDIPVPAVKRVFTWSSITSRAAVEKAAAVKSPELSMTSVEPILSPFLILKF